MDTVQMIPRKFIVTIDGPAGSGKTTVAREIAKKLEFDLLESGAFYRYITWSLINRGDNLEILKENEEPFRKTLLSILSELRVELSPEGTRLFREGRALRDELRSKEVERAVSVVSAHPLVREVVTEFLRSVADERRIITEGRDMGTTVFPQANLKVFLTADLEVRAKRRAKDFSDRTEEEIKKNLLERDELDRSREVSPLRKPEGALEIDTTCLSIEEVVERIISEIKRLLYVEAQK